MPRLAAAGSLLLAAGALHCGNGPPFPLPQPSPSPPGVTLGSPNPNATCGSFSGAWTATQATACGGTSTGPATVVQQGCRISVGLPLGGTMTMDLSGDAGRGVIVLPATCDSGATVPGRIEVHGGSELLALFGDGQACCRHGTLTLRR